MPTFTIHQPPPKGAAATAEDLVFVRDGFHFWAFLLAPLWLLAHRLWLVLLLYVAVTAAINAGLVMVGASGTLTFLASLCIALLVGFEAATLWRWTLQRRRWKTLGFVVGESEEMAERRFYAEWINRPGETPPRAAAAPALRYATPVRRGPPSGTDVIGLFPEPGSQR